MMVCVCVYMCGSWYVVCIIYVHVEAISEPWMSFLGILSTLFHFQLIICISLCVCVCVYMCVFVHVNDVGDGDVCLSQHA